MAWPLSMGRLRRAATRPLAPLLATVLNLLIIPLLIWPLAALAGAELGPGLIVAAATPSTLASAAVLTRYAGGDDSVAIMVTILTNSTCFLVLPFWIMVQTGNQIESAALIQTIYKLFFFVVLPIAAAQIARLHYPSGQWATLNKPWLSKLALIGILVMVFIGAVKMGLRFAGGVSTPPGSQELVIATAILLAIHTLIFWLGIWLACRIGLPRDEQIAIGFSGSQKTLMIGLSTAINLGFSIIPIVLYHALQLLVDTVFAERLRAQEEERQD